MLEAGAPGDWWKGSLGGRRGYFPSNYCDVDAGEAPLRDHPALRPFLKLLRVGLPRGAVAKKMAEEGVDARLLDRDLDAPPDAETKLLLAGAAPAPAAAPARRWGDKSSSKGLSLIHI